MVVESLNPYRSEIRSNTVEKSNESPLVVGIFPRNCTLLRSWKKRVTRIAGSELVFQDQYSSNFLPSVITICFSARPTYFPRSVAPLLLTPQHSSTRFCIHRSLETSSGTRSMNKCKFEIRHCTFPVTKH